MASSDASLYSEGLPFASTGIVTTNLTFRSVFTAYNESMRYKKIKKKEQ